MNQVKYKDLIIGKRYYVVGSAGEKFEGTWQKDTNHWGNVRWINKAGSYKEDKNGQYLFRLQNDIAYENYTEDEIVLEMI